MFMLVFHEAIEICKGRMRPNFHIHSGGFFSLGLAPLRGWFVVMGRRKAIGHIPNAIIIQSICSCSNTWLILRNQDGKRGLLLMVVVVKAEGAIVFCKEQKER